MITVLASAFAALSQPAATAPQAVQSQAFREARRAYSVCLDRSVEKIEKTYSEQSERYRAFINKCLDERSDMIVRFITDNSFDYHPSKAEARWGYFEWVSKHADEVAGSKVRFLDRGIVLW
ncbi:MAG TPA: hypothetical protein VGW34_11485 [Allosphingosinicella sp.]|nr:hypothetical protein [Allosphingosinicella sp.]